GRSILPAPRRPPARGRSIITSAFMPFAARRSPVSWRCRLRRSNNARNLSSCARSKRACASMRLSSTACRSASTRPPISSGRAKSSAGGNKARSPHPEERPVWAASRRMRMTRLTLRDGPRTRGRRAETRSRALLRVRRSETLTRSGGVRTGTAMTAAKKIVFQGEPGANSHLASRDVYPDYEPVPSATFEDAFAAINTGEAAFGMIPIENSLAARVAAIHHLLPDSGLHIVAEHFMPVRHQLLAPKGATLKGIKTVESHVHALGQCRKAIRKLGIKPVVAADTAGSAREVA